MKRVAKHTVCAKPGEYVYPGQEIELTKAQAEELDKAGVLEPLGIPSQDSKPAGGAGEPAPKAHVDADPGT